VTLPVATPQRYRFTRPAFDIVSVYGCLDVHELPTAVFVAVLGERGYTATNVRTQLSRMVHRRLLQRETSGKSSRYAMRAQLRASFDLLSGAGPVRAYSGSFSQLAFAVPESDRQLRDRIIYLAGRAGYGKLRPGLHIAAHDDEKNLRANIGPLPDTAWLDFATLVPRDFPHARALAARFRSGVPREGAGCAAIAGASSAGSGTTGNRDICQGVLRPLLRRVGGGHGHSAAAAGTLRGCRLTGAFSSSHAHSAPRLRSGIEGFRERDCRSRRTVFAVSVMTCDTRPR